MDANEKAKWPTFTDAVEKLKGPWANECQCLCDESIMCSVHAAAPALLEALELSLVEQERARLAMEWLDTPGMVKARAAIEQAKGA